MPERTERVFTQQKWTFPMKEYFDRANQSSTRGEVIAAQPDASTHVVRHTS